MNKSEIAISELMKLEARQWRDSSGKEIKGALWVRRDDVARLWERAIAESQVPRGFGDEPLTLPDKCEYCLAGNHRYHGVEISRTGTTSTGCYFCHCKDELGDGEPSPKPAKIGGINHSPLPWTFTYFAKADGSDIKTPQDVADTVAHSALQCDGTMLWGVTLDEKDEQGRTQVICYTGNGPHSEANAKLIVAAINVLKVESGAAQEVSPPSPVEILKSHWLMEIVCDHSAKTDQPLCACGWRGPVCPNVGDAVTSWANHAAELIRGDTRELKAALKGLMDSARSVVTGQKSGRQHHPELHLCESCDSNIEILRDDLAEAERLLG